jgi:hypothetical protein
MDQSTTYGIVPVVPEVLLWMIRMYEPEVFGALQSIRQVPELLSLLEHYGGLRQRAEEIEMERTFQFEMESGCDGSTDGRVSLDDIQEAINQSSLDAELPTVAGTLRKVVNAAQERRVWFWNQYNMQFRFAEDVDLKRLKGSCLTPHASSMTYQPLTEAAGSTADPLHTAVMHGRMLLLTADTGQHSAFWTTVYGEVVGNWVERDLPSIAAALLARAETSDFFRAINDFIFEMRAVEDLWNVLSPQLRNLLLAQNLADSKVVHLVRSVVRTRRSADSESDTIRLTNLVIEMVRRRAEPPTFVDCLPVSRTSQSSPLIDRIRDRANEEARYVALTSDLPAELKAMTSERYCLAVRMDSTNTEMIADIEQPAETGIDTFVAEQSDGTGQAMVAVSHAFWCRKDQFLELMWRFRSSIPVLYVGDEDVVLVEYPCSYFPMHAKLRDGVRGRDVYRRTSEIDGGFYYCAPFSSASAHVPILIGSIVDWSSQQPTFRLSDDFRVLRRTALLASRDESPSCQILEAFRELQRCDVRLK